MSAKNSGAICSSVESDQVSTDRAQGKERQQTETGGTSYSENSTTQNQKRAKLPAIDLQKEEQLQTEMYDNYDHTKIPKNEWHLILNHVTPNVLTLLERNPNLDIPSLKAIKSSLHDMNCSSCFETS